MSNSHELDTEEVEQDAIQAKLDLITITTSKNLESMNTAIALNTAKNSYPSADATKVGHIAIANPANISTMETATTDNAAAIVALDNILPAYVPFTDFCFVKGAVSLNLTDTLVQVDWNDANDSKFGTAVTYNDSAGTFTLATTGHYKIDCMLTFISQEADERAVIVELWGLGSGIGSGSQIAALTHMTRHDSDDYSYSQIVFNCILNLSSGGGAYVFKARSLSGGTGALTSTGYCCISRIS